MFIQTIKPGLTIGMRTYQIGSVLKIDEVRGRYEVESKNAVVHSGPEFEPAPEPDAEPNDKPKSKPK